MKERLLGFIFCAILVAFAVNVALDGIHHHYSASLWFQDHWVLYDIAIPAAVLLALAWWMGFFRPRGARWGDAAALLTIALLVYAMLGAGYSCWKYCF
jgi:hypothetical protein